MADIANPYATFGRYSADLCLFLLVAQHGQVSRAAREAGLSQPRLSQRMQFLEESLGKQLLVRERRGVSLTAAGQDLRNALLAPLSGAAEAFSRFQNAPRRGEVVILSDIAFASFRILPEFGSLNAAFKDLGISLLTVQIPEPRQYPDADAIIRMEPRREPGPHEALLLRERVSAVCSPAYKAAHPDMRAPRDLLDKTLIGLSARSDAPWCTWPRWLREHGCARGAAQDFIAFNSYDHVVHAARSGLGVALGWEGLIDVDAPNSGLVRAVPSRLESDLGYVLRILPGRANPDTLRVFEWLADRFGAAPG